MYNTIWDDEVIIDETPLVVSEKYSDEELISAASVINDVFLGGMFTILFLVLVGGSIVAEEFNKGTIKQLLVRPNKITKTRLSRAEFLISVNKEIFTC